MRWLTEQYPFDLVVAPSGYGLPLVPTGAAMHGTRERR